MGRYNWEKPTPDERADGARLATYAEDGARILFKAGDRGNGDLYASFVLILTEGRRLTTWLQEDWPEIEKYIPRSEWPKPMFANVTELYGVLPPAELHPDPEIARAVARAETVSAIRNEIIAHIDD
ncbi:hypothetical protein [Actinobaculum sp. 352]|uniref:hypothetical protein n=1 Tax=Actinobaculum sp. 352 TaxID=2490946 RepID=UPI000F7F50AB|nr:hypothetical protein [Actinobaculum sp. 352]RTE50378.1 hypothetical protein EKN07_04060 [Actinobaculum sp. 352]